MEILNLIKEVQKIDLKDNDILLITSDRDMSLEQYDNLTKYFKHLFYSRGLKNVDIVIKPKDVNFKIIRKEDADGE